MKCICFVWFIYTCVILFSFFFCIFRFLDIINHLNLIKKKYLKLYDSSYNSRMIVEQFNCFNHSLNFTALSFS